MAPIQIISFRLLSKLSLKYRKQFKVLERNMAKSLPYSQFQRLSTEISTIANIGQVEFSETVANYAALLLYLNLYVFRRKILVGHIISTVQVIWPKAYLS
jgi:hypothetical protein